MITQFFECAIRYEKTLDSGMIKNVTEKYLVDALSFTEAEARIIEQITPFVTGEFMVKDIKRTNISEIIDDKTGKSTGDYWFKVKLKFIMLDEKTGAEKNSFSHVLVEASNIDDATENVNAAMNGTMCDYVVESVSLSQYIDVFIHKENRHSDK